MERVLDIDKDASVEYLARGFRCHRGEQLCPHYQAPDAVQSPPAAHAACGGWWSASVGKIYEEHVLVRPVLCVLWRMAAL